ncbi:hypothetical protein Taro_006764 [Colocasia esculenta]|uniref:Uncharacterized protein n=2 Tax=Colocasia esculenta TaxID=4460 RepID=A0A843TTL3_COLES|nr:hypothetical protein [Colocasia esculenta]
MLQALSQKMKKWSSSVDTRSRTNIYCKDGVDTPHTVVNTMFQDLRQKVDTRDLSQGIDLPVWDSVSTHLMGRSTHSGISVT